MLFCCVENIRSLKRREKQFMLLDGTEYISTYKSVLKVVYVTLMKTARLKIPRERHECRGCVGLFPAAPSGKIASRCAPGSKFN
jgi:AMMECR1 domain-containing protein